MTQTKKAFTLVEAIVVIMIIVILTTISFVVNKTYIPNTRDTRRYSEITKIYNKIQGEILINPKLNVENFIT
ncbi:MAG: prepilin-type N-terminal cleavage/methylation domain-containing protein [Candidatus Peribacteria bacterium]|jgi:prepilin-type N-terminal cleavage/methylation domain-containing protein|nr:prepilin-type N-terminal cleavage/methylation domain-containing protein [Candidatus Peribacteria bacterium]